MEEIKELLRKKIKEKFKEIGKFGFCRCEADGNYGMVMYSETEIKPFGYALELNYENVVVGLNDLIGVDLAYLLFDGSADEIDFLEEEIEVV